MAVCFDSGLDDETRELATKYTEEHGLRTLTHIYAQQPDSINLQYIPHKMFIDGHQIVLANYEDVDWETQLASTLPAENHKNVMQSLMQKLHHGKGKPGRWVGRVAGGGGEEE